MATHVRRQLRPGQSFAYRALLLVTGLSIFGTMPLVAPQVLAAGTFYVATNGSDEATGTASTPWRTLQHAVDHASTGGRIVVRAGTYPGFSTTRSGLTVNSGEGERVVFNSQVRVRGVSAFTIHGVEVQGILTPHEGGLEIEDSRGVSISGVVLRGNSFGLKLKNVSRSVVADSRMTNNASGIEVHYGGSDLVISGNTIDGNTRYLEASRSATGINFYRTTGPITFSGNEVHGNQLADFSSGVGVEIYAGGNVAITGNRFWDNGNVLETGTRDGVPCPKVQFTRNVAYRSPGIEHKGLILRCATDSLIAHNTLVGLDKFAFSVSHNHGPYGGSVERLRIVNNIVVDGRAYSIDSPLPESVEIDYNLAYTGEWSTAEYGRHVAYVAGLGNTKEMAVFRSWTGYEENGLVGDPMFVSSPTGDFRLQSSSPAVDRGRILVGPFFGAAPDLGYAELSVSTPGPTPTVVRLGGSDRHATAAAISA